jgi:hypothetical protein
LGRRVKIPNRHGERAFNLMGGLPRLEPGITLPAAAFDFEPEREKLEQVTERENAEKKLSATHDEERAPRGALHLRHRLQRIGLGCHSIILRAGLHMISATVR